MINLNLCYLYILMVSFSLVNIPNIIPESQKFLKNLQCKLFPIQMNKELDLTFP